MQNTHLVHEHNNFANAGLQHVVQHAVAVLLRIVATVGNRRGSLRLLAGVTAVALTVFPRRNLHHLTAVCAAPARLRRSVERRRHGIVTLSTDVTTRHARR